jgi:hypothetical protein
MGLGDDVLQENVGMGKRWGYGEVESLTMDKEEVGFRTILRRGNGVGENKGLKEGSDLALGRR